jgi:hypothetical protein
MPKSVQVRFYTDTSQVLYINSIIDSYEGIGIVRTIDRNKGYVTVYSTDGMYKEVLNVVESLKAEGVPINSLQVVESEKLEV